MGEGDGEFSTCTNFFFHSLLVQEFFSAETLCTNFFQTSIAFFRTVKSRFIIYVFVLYRLFYTHNSSKDKGHFLKQNLFKDVHAVREEEATWGGRLPRAFLQSLTSRIPLPQPIIMVPYTIHQNSPSVVPSTPKCQSKKKVPV